MTGVAKRGFAAPLCFLWSGGDAIPLFSHTGGCYFRGLITHRDIPDGVRRVNAIPETMLQFAVYAVGQCEASRGRLQPAVDDLDEAIVAKPR